MTQPRAIKRIGRAIIPALAAVLTAACIDLASLEQQQYTAPMPVSRWGGKYVFQYPTPTATGRAYDVNVAVVNALYREEESALLDPAFNKVGKGLSASMGSDLDKLLVAKGLTASGPYPSHDDITYAEKKGAALMLAPRVFITTEIRYDGPVRFVPDGRTRLPDGRLVAQRAERSFTMVTTGWVSFVMQEPLSGEKMWIKKLELEPIEARGVEVYNAEMQYKTQPAPLGLGPPSRVATGYTQTAELLHDGKSDALADALQQMYPTIMERFWRMLDPEEMILLKEKSGEIRARKVY
jgi:hypothetical protein